MWACICNAIKDSEIEEHLDNGEKDPKKILQLCGGDIKCGVCVEEIVERIEEVKKQ